jgi:hypothetical protein
MVVGSRSGVVVAGPDDGHPAPGVVDRRTATLMYAGWDRRSAMRRKVPLTSCAPAEPAQSTGGDSVLRRRHPGAGYGWWSSWRLQGGRWSGIPGGHLRP